MLYSRPKIQSIIAWSKDINLLEKIEFSLDQKSEKLIHLSSPNLELNYSLIKKINPHILIFDISSFNISALDLLEEMENKFFEVIFISKNNADALKVIPFQPIDYLVKPIDITQLKMAIRKAVKNVEQNLLFQILLDKYGELEFDLNTNGVITFPLLKGRTTKIITKDIIRIEADGVLSRVYLRDKPKEHLKINISIKDCELLLGKQNFFRIHRQHLINMDAINPFSNSSKSTIKLFTEEVLQIARRRQSEFESALLSFRKIKNGLSRLM